MSALEYRMGSCQSTAAGGQVEALKELLDVPAYGIRTTLMVVPYRLFGPWHHQSMVAVVTLADGTILKVLEAEFGHWYNVRWEFTSLAAIVTHPNCVPGGA